MLLIIDETTLGVTVWEALFDFLGLLVEEVLKD